MNADKVNLILTIDGEPANKTLKDLNNHARDLKRKLQNMDIGSDDFKKTTEELQKVNGQIDEINTSLRPVKKAIEGVNTETSLWKTSLATAIGELGRLNLQDVLDRLWEFSKTLFNVVTTMDQLSEKTNTVFGDSAMIVRAYADQNAESLGLARKEYENLTTAAGDLLVPMGFAKDAAAQLSSELTNQAGRLSEWASVPTTAAEAHQILTKSLMGERDALDRLGIKISDDMIKSELKRKGLEKLTGESLRQATALITLEQITQQSTSANEAFAKNTDSLTRKKAKLRAQFQETIQTLSKGFIPVVGFVIDTGLALWDVLTAIVTVLISIPKFVYDNRVAFGLLAAGLVKLNAQMIATQFTIIAWNAAMKIGAAYTWLQTTAMSALNMAMRANLIGMVVTAIGVLVLALTQAYQKSETFREVLAGIVEVAKSVGSGLRKLFTGDLKGAINEFGDAINGAFTRGFDTKKAEESAKKVAEVAAEGGKKSGQAYSEGYKGKIDEMYKDLKNKGEVSPEELEKERKKGEKLAKEQFEARLKEIEIQHGKERIVLEQARLDKEIKESAFAKSMLNLDKAQYEAEMDAFRQFGQTQTKEYIQLQEKLIEVKGKLSPRNNKEVALIATRGGIAPVESNKPDESKLGAFEAQANAEQAALRHKFVIHIKSELEFNLQLANLQRTKAQERLDLLYELGLAETAQYKAALEDKARADEHFQETKIENVKRTKEIEDLIVQESLGIASDSLQVGIDLLSQDENARKKHAAAIKAFSVAQVGINLAAEISGIWKNANSNPINALVPGWGAIFGGIQTALAVGRSVVQVQKISSQKYAEGGYTGLGIGRPDETGFRPVGIVHEKEWVSPKWLTEHPVYGQYVQALESVRSRGYATGGYATTPTFTSMPGPAAVFSQGIDQTAFVTAVDNFSKWVSSLPTEIKARVNYIEIETSASNLNKIRSEANL